MSATFYGTTDGVVTRTGVAPEDLGLDDADALVVFLEELLTEAADLMDRQMRTSYLATDIPAGLNGIACDVVADAVRVMVQSRQTPVVRIDDFAVRTVSSVSLSADAKDRLKLYSAGRGVVTVDIDLGEIAGLPTTFSPSQLDTIDDVDDT